MTIQVLLADDSDLMLLGARAVLEADHRFTVAGTARALNDLLAMRVSARPDTIVVGDWLAGVDALTIATRVRRQSWMPRLILIGTVMDGLLIRDLFKAGVDGYLYRADDLAEHLTLAIDTTLRNRPYLSPTANAEYLVAMQSPARDWQLDDECRDILRLLADGQHIGAIAYEKKLPLRRVYWVREKLRQRFGAQTNEHLIHRASAEGFLNGRLSI